MAKKTTILAAQAQTGIKPSKSEIGKLENEIFQSNKSYNNIVKLMLYAKEETNQIQGQLDQPAPATLSLCRIFVQLIGVGALEKTKETTDAEAVIIKWLRDRFSEYVTLVIETFYDRPSTTTIAMLMAIAKSEFQQSAKTAWRNGIFNRLLEILLLVDQPTFDDARAFFASEYLEKNRDLTYYFFKSIRLLYKNNRANPTLPTNGIDILLSWKPFGKKFDKSAGCFGDYPAENRQFSAAACLDEAQDIWLLFLGSGLDKRQRKHLLNVFTESVSPWFQKPELLLDFLTDSYETGGSTSLLALSGVFFLISDRNLEYPQFYQKLYSLLDHSLLHSKHRSHFFRLLDVFMSSTHLPAALVASFIKRMCRLALFAPPAAIVIVIPWVYNLLKRHPTTTFMIHRVIRDPAERKRIEEEGFQDPFNEAETDPLVTRAIESCLWELVTLQSHYHPNVATLSKIVAQEFLKESYQLEDFLDHSYASIIQTDLVKRMKHVPAVEYEIPRHILQDGDSGLSDMGAAFFSLATHPQ